MVRYSPPGFLIFLLFFLSSSTFPFLPLLKYKYEYKYRIAQPRNNEARDPRFLFNQTSPTNIAMVSEAHINSHNERPEGVEAALWISNPSLKRRGRLGLISWRIFLRYTQQIPNLVSKVVGHIMQMEFLQVIGSSLMRIHSCGRNDHLEISFTENGCREFVAWWMKTLFCYQKVVQVVKEVCVNENLNTRHLYTWRDLMCLGQL